MRTLRHNARIALLLLLCLLTAGCSFRLKREEIGSDALKKGIDAFQRGEYDQSRLIFSEVIRTRPGSPDLEEAQWYLGASAEKQGKREEAREQYTLYLKNFPSGRHTAEAQERLALIAAGGASAAAPPPAPPLARTRSSGRYGKFSGALTTEYLYDDQISPEPSVTVQNRVSEFLDFRWKSAGETDLRIYFSGMYSHDLLDHAHSRSRISKLFGEWNEAAGFYSLRFGRQPASGNTLFSRFDGLSAVYRPSNLVHLNVAAGYPVEAFGTHNPGVKSDRQFYELYAAVYDLFHLNGRIYYTEEFNERFSTRRAVGWNGFWIRDDWTVTSILDYDLDFKSWNDQLLGLDYSRGIFRYSGAVERRKNPFLDYATALFDFSLLGNTPPVTSLGALREIKSRDEIRSLALNNTTDSLEFRIGITADFSSVWRGDLRYAHIQSDAVEMVNLVGTKVDKRADRIALFLSERNGLRLSEIWTFLLMAQPATDSNTTTATSTLSRYWRNGALGSLRVRWEKTEFKNIDSRSTRIVPGAAANFPLFGEIQASVEGDYSIEKNNSSPETLKTIQTRISLTVPF
ncbi:MAG: tetratricopeptide repeat protein [Candidatus Manganitrophaceae bacterium]|nr:MAG: tetratricopeptide repeat protein [Candidatus Manganitrophaceae bacterium]